ncbi:DUF2313 domain-containing protein [Tianweitania sp. BSSL-BM11]|uniref:DUF2313 domain-containing protein n=1 Tax=Tianweitania aestuarii TaxID=2814886 RepID=A0ABS5RV60_9HYPH|nr:putative phage tail protein [Tianweitania aestuarii]MBS9720166.1 DUF2313 domain-containing protein [Tianweitania aestuarii]
MSAYCVNSEYPLFLSYDGSPVVYVDCREPENRFEIDTTDALSKPAVDDLLPAGLSLWPRGAAWGTPDGVAPSTDSVLAGFTRALLGAFADLYASLWQLTNESRSRTLVNSLPDWEADFALPEPCITEPQTEAERRRHLEHKVAAQGAISPEDFVRLAAQFGFVVAIEEPEAFRSGTSRCGELAEVANVALEQQWVVHVLDVPFEQFQTGIGEAGVTRLLDFDMGDLQCLFRRAAPAWTYPIFSVAPWPTPYLLATESGAVLITETGARLIAPAVAN